MEEIVLNATSWWIQYTVNLKVEEQNLLKKLLTTVIKSSLDNYNCCILSTTYQPQFLLYEVIDACNIMDFTNQFPPQTTMIITQSDIYISDENTDAFKDINIINSVDFPLQFDSLVCHDFVLKCLLEITKK